MMQLDGLACALDTVTPQLDLAFAATGGERPDPDAIWIGQWGSNGWSGWSGIGQPVRGALPYRPALVSDEGVLEIVASGYDGAVWHATQAEPAAGWLGWESLGKPGGKPVITERQGGRTPDPSPVLAFNLDLSLEVFVVRSDLSVWHRDRPRGGADWTDWAPLGHPGGPNAGTPGPIVADANSVDGRLELFTTDRDRRVQHCWQKQPGGNWSSWESLGRPGGQPAGFELATAIDADGCLTLFTVGTADGAVWQRQQSRPGGSWGDWVSLGGQGRGFAEVAVAQAGHNVLVLFATEQPGPSSSGNGLWQRTQLTPGGDWSPWQSRRELVTLGQQPGALEGPVLMLDPEGKLQLYVRVSGTANTHQAIQIKDDLTDPMAWGINFLAFQPV
jgi:hypothetical protein